MVNEINWLTPTEDLINRLETVREQHSDRAEVEYERLFARLERRAARGDADAIEHLDDEYGTNFANAAWVAAWRASRDNR
jgi:hypothetical protein